MRRNCFLFTIVFSFVQIFSGMCFAEHKTVNVVNDNFDNITTFNQLDGWSFTDGEIGKSITLVPDATVGKCITIKKSDSTDLSAVRKFEKISGEVSVELKAKINKVTGSLAPYIYCGSSNIISSQFANKNICLYYGDPATTTNAFTVNENTWYTLRYEIDTNNQLFDLYVDDVLCAENKAFRNYGKRIDSIRFGISGANSGEISFSDINISYVEGSAVDEKTIEDSYGYEDYYLSKSERAIMMLVDSPFALVNHEKIAIGDDNTVKPFEIDGCVMVPVRFIADNLQLNVEWDERTETAVLSNYEKIIKMTIGSNQMLVNGESVELETAPIISNGRTFLPIRPLAEAFDRNTYWDDRGLAVISESKVEFDSQEDAQLISDAIDFLADAQNNETLIYYVSTDGFDDWCGTIGNSNCGLTNGPFLTIQRAKKAVGEALEENPNRDVIVYIRDGDYCVDKTLAFTPQDMAADWYSVTYKNYPGENPVINGGDIITGWKPYNENIYKVNVGKDWNVSLLSENGEISTKARYPNAGEERREGYSAVFEEVVGNAKRSFKFSPGDIPLIDNTSGLELFIWPAGVGGTRNWKTNTAKFISLDYENCIGVVDSDTSYTMTPGSRYYVQGAIELLDTPGEFYYDSISGYLYYWPKNLPIEDQIIVAPKVNNILSFKGDSLEKPIRGITIDGIVLRNSKNPGGNGVFMQNACNINIKNCIINSIGGYGVHMNGYCQNNSVQGCKIYDVGNNGIYLNGYSNILKYYSNRNKLTNNLIDNIGLFVGAGCGIGMDGSGDNIVMYNKVQNTPRFSISWGNPTTKMYRGTILDGVYVTDENAKSFAHARNNIIAFNDVSKANIDSSDSGLIYTWGGGRDTVIYNNFVHDSEIHFQFGYGIYLDDDSDGNIVKNNVLYDLQKYGRGSLDSAIVLKGVDNICENNLLINNNSKSAMYTNEMADDYNRDIEAYRNVIYDSGYSLYSFANGNHTRFKYSDYNLFYNSKNPEFCGISGLGSYGIYDLNTWKSLSGHDLFTKIAEPMIVDVSKGDYRLTYNSPAYTLGYKDIDFKNVGLTHDFIFGNADEQIDRIFVKEFGSTADASYVYLSVDEVKQLDISGRTVSGYVADLSDAHISFSSNSDAVEVGSDGTITGKHFGLAQITVAVTKDGIEKNLVLDVIVDDYMQNIAIELIGTNMVVNDSESLNVVAYSALNDIIKDVTLMFRSDNPSVINIDDDGLVKAQRKGEANITVTAISNDTVKKATIPMYVHENMLKKIDSSVANDVFVGTTSKFAVTGIMTDGSVANMSKATLKYTYPDDSIVKIDANGNIRGLLEGKTEVVVRATINGVTRQVSVPVNVYPAEGVAAKMVFEEDFDDYETGSVPADWKITAPFAKHQVYIAEIPNSTDKSLCINKTGKYKTGDVLALKTFEPMSGRVTIEEKHRIEDDQQKLMPYIIDSNGTILISMWMSNGIYVYTGKTTIKIQDVDSGSWYDVKLNLDTDKDMFDVYVNGKLIMADIPFRTPVDNVAAIRYGISGTNTGIVYLNGLKVYYTEILP